MAVDDSVGNIQTKAAPAMLAPIAGISLREAIEQMWLKVDGDPLSFVGNTNTDRVVQRVCRNRYRLTIR